MTPPLEVRAAAPQGIGGASALGGVMIGFGAFLCVAGLAALVTAGGVGLFTGVLLLGLGVLLTMQGVRGMKALQGLRRNADAPVVLRLDADGVRLREFEVVPERPGPEGGDDGPMVPQVPDDAGWLQLPWSWISSVTHTALDARSADRLGLARPFEVLRFTVSDDEVLDLAPSGAEDQLSGFTRWMPWWGLTGRQLRTVAVAPAGNEGHQQVLEWLRQHRPQLPVVSGTTLPWPNAASPGHREQRPRVAILSADVRLRRLLVDVVAATHPATPVAFVANERDRADLERAGAEVRMLDLPAQHAAAGEALRGCEVLIYVPSPDAAAGGGGHDGRIDAAAAVVDAARRAKVDRFVLVADGTLPAHVGGPAMAAATSAPLPWTVFRSGTLTDEPPTGEVQVGEDGTGEVVPGRVPRADLAQLVVASLRSDDALDAVWTVAG